MFESLGRALGLYYDGPDIHGRDQARRPAPRPPAAVASPGRPPAGPVDLTALLRAAVDLAGGPDRFAVRCRVLHRDDVGGGRQLLDPPAPWRGQLQLLFARDPNTGNHVLLLIRAGLARTCHEAAAATFGIDPAHYRPTREV